MEISKRDKKVLRQIIDFGLQKEYAEGLSKAQKVLKNWNKDSENHREAYMQLYKQVINFDKKIGRRYNNMTGSNYHFVVAAQLADNIISESDLENLSGNLKNAIILISTR